MNVNFTGKENCTSKLPSKRRPRLEDSLPVQFSTVLVAPRIYVFVTFLSTCRSSAIAAVGLGWHFNFSTYSCHGKLF